jgi:hypothetical protein
MMMRWRVTERALKILAHYFLGSWKRILRILSEHEREEGRIASTPARQRPWT